MSPGRRPRTVLLRLSYVGSGALAFVFAVALVAWTVHGALGRPSVSATRPAAATAAPAAAPTVTPTPRPTPTASDVPVITGADGSPLADQQLWVGTEGPAVAQERSLAASGRTADAAAIRRIADEPVGSWFTSGSGGFGATARRVVTDAGDADRLPLLVLRYIPIADGCGAGDPRAADADAYRTWIASLTDAFVGRAALIVLEPGAVPEVVDGCVHDNDSVDARYEMLKDAVVALKANAKVRVYLDAGRPGRVSAIKDLAYGLRRAGVDKADGFAVNVGGFDTTESDIAYGTQLSDALHGAHFVVDTGRNGNGPPSGASGRSAWCNPPGRKLGTPPTTRTGVPRVDAYLWVKAPGESDGACGGGAPAAGQYWPDYALSLATP